MRTVGLCPTPHQGTEYPGPTTADVAWLAEQSLFPLLLGDTKDPIVDGVVLLARRPKAANPGCKASGERKGKSPEEKRAFPSGIYPFLSWARSPQTFRNPSETAGTCILYSLMQLRLNGSRGRSPLAQSLRARSPQRNPLVGTNQVT